MSAFVARLKKELQMLEEDPPHGICAWLPSDKMDHLEAKIEGPADTPYEKGIFKLEIDLPKRYPFEPPKVRFITPIYHPNIDNGGRICLNTLVMPPKGCWTPSLNVSSVLTSIQSLIAEPNPDDGLVLEITNEYKHNRSKFLMNAKNWTKKYATEGSNDSTNNELESKEEEQTGKEEEEEETFQEDSSETESSTKKRKLEEEDVSETKRTHKISAMKEKEEKEEIVSEEEEDEDEENTSHSVFHLDDDEVDSDFELVQGNCFLFEDSLLV